MPWGGSTLGGFAEVEEGVLGAPEARFRLCCSGCPQVLLRVTSREGAAWLDV